MVKMGQQTLQAPRFVSGASLITGTIPGLALQQRTGTTVSSVFQPSSYNRVQAVNTLFAAPFLISRRCNLDRIGVNVAVAGAGGALIRVGIYDHDGNLYPDELLVDGGAIAGDAVALVLATIDLDVDPGIYWMGYVDDDGNIQCSGSVDPTWPTISHCFVGTRGWAVAQAYGALPDPYTAGGAFNGMVAVPFYRISAWL